MSNAHFTISYTGCKKDAKVLKDGIYYSHLTKNNEYKHSFCKKPDFFVTKAL